MPNIEWSAAWSAGEGIPKTMPHEVWEKLSPHAQHVCRYVVADPGVWPPGAGVVRFNFWAMLGPLFRPSWS